MAESISATQEFKVRADIDQVWSFIEDFTNWGKYMPGYVSSERLSPDDFTWVLQADLGSMSRRVTMDIHVTRWGAPGDVDFELQGRGEPFSGSGSYRAVQAPGGAVQVELRLDMLPQGSMAKVIRVFAVPLLARTANVFAGRLAEAIESRFPQPAPAQGEVPVRSNTWRDVLRRWWVTLLGRPGRGSR